MSFRHTLTEFSEDDFAGTGLNKSTLTRTYTGPALTAWRLDNTVMPSGPDVTATLTGLNATIREFEADDADGTSDPVERQIQCPAGGPLCTRSVDGATLTIAPAGGIPFARATALRQTLDSLGYVPAP